MTCRLCGGLGTGVGGCAALTGWAPPRREAGMHVYLYAQTQTPLGLRITLKIIGLVTG